jgi:hypothetical protein
MQCFADVGQASSDAGAETLCGLGFSWLVTSQNKVLFLCVMVIAWWLYAAARTSFSGIELSTVLCRLTPFDQAYCIDVHFV